MPASLSASRRIRFFAFTSFYVAQGLPIGLLTVALPAWLAANGASAGEVANFVAITTLPWGFKLLAGPMMDRFKFPALGGRRPWVMAAQSGLLLSLTVLAMSGEAVQALPLLTAIGFTINSFAAVQDVAVDGMAIDVLPEAERGRANAFMAFGQVAGYAASGAFCGWTLNAFGLAATAAFLAVGVACILAIAIAFRERDGERMLPWTAGSSQHQEHHLKTSWGAIVRNLVRVLVLPSSLLLIFVSLCWRIPDGLFITSAPVIVTQDLGWQSSDYSYWYSNASLCAALFGLMIGPLIDRSGAKTFLALGLAASAAVYLTIALAVDMWQYWYVLITAMFATQLCSQVVFVSAIAIHMNVCWHKVAATQFAVYMAWMNLSRSLGAKVYAEVSPLIELGDEFLLMAAFSAAGAVAVLFVAMAAHQARLDQLHIPAPVDDELADIPARF